MKLEFILITTLSIVLTAGLFGLANIDNVFAQSPEKIDDWLNKKIEKNQPNFDEIKIKKQNNENNQQELKNKKIELKTQRKNLELKQVENSKNYQEKLKEIMKNYQKDANLSSSSNQNSQKTEKSKETHEKSEDIRDKLLANSQNLDPRTKNLLDTVSDGTYLGEKFDSSIHPEKYELIFDSIEAHTMGNKFSTPLVLTGEMIFDIYDKSNSDLKLELLECRITVDQISYNCGFGKARTVSFNQSDVKNSLVILAFLENELVDEAHTSLKIFLNSKIPISEIEHSKVSIMGPQSKVAHLWSINGTATLSKIIPPLDGLISKNNLIDSSLPIISSKD